MTSRGRCLYSQRRHRPHFAGPGCLRRTGPALAGPGRTAHGSATLVRAPDARTVGAAALATPPWPRLRAGHAAGRAGIACGASGPAAQRRATVPARAAPGHRAGGAYRRPRRRRRGLPGEDRRRLGAAIPTRVGGRQPAHCTAVGKALLAFSDPATLDDFDVDLLARKTRYSISTRRQLTDELAAIRARGFAYERAESVSRIRLCRGADRRPRCAASPRSRSAVRWIG